MVNIFKNFSSIIYLKIIREILYFLQKISMIFIISFATIGDNEEVYPINKVILCIFICLFSFYGQFQTQPFITKDLNHLNSIANVIMILTLLFALFSAICENLAMQIFFFIWIIFTNFRIWICFLLQNRDSFINAWFFWRWLTYFLVIGC